MDEEWMLEGSCRQYDPDLWFPTKENPTESQAKEICGSCPVEAVCCLYAISHSLREGVWGGKNRAERDKISKRWGGMKERGRPILINYKG